MSNSSWYGRPLHSGLSLVTPPAEEPVSLAEAKQYLRVEIDDDDDLIRSLIVAARRYAESRTKRQLVTATWLLVFDQFPVLGTQWSIIGADIKVPLPPLQSVTSIEYQDMAGHVTVFDPSRYTVDTNSQPGRIVPLFAQPWPVVRPTAASVQIEFVAGYGAAAGVPDTFKTAIKLAVGHWYRKREAVSEGGMSEVPFAVGALLGADDPGVYSKQETSQMARSKKTDPNHSASEAGLLLAAFHVLGKRLTAFRSRLPVGDDHEIDRTVRIRGKISVGAPTVYTSTKAPSARQVLAAVFQAMSPRTRGVMETRVLQTLWPLHEGAELEISAEHFDQADAVLAELSHQEKHDRAGSIAGDALSFEFVDSPRASSAA